MLHFEPGQNLTPLSIGELLEKSTQLSPEEVKCICQTFMLPEHQPKGPPPYVSAFFTEMGQIILNMISFVMGFNTSEYVDELTLVLLSTSLLDSLLLSNMTLHHILQIKSMINS